MDFSILYAIQEIRTPFLDRLMPLVSALGNGGVFWLLLAAVLLIFKKTRSCGILILISMAICYVTGNMLIKNLVARQRPCALDTSVELLIPIPREYSFPSGHTLHGFTAAMIIFMHSKKAGIPALILAAVIAFSRMYLFVHFPTDILGGIILGTAAALLVWMVYQRMQRKQSVT